MTSSIENDSFFQLLVEAAQEPRLLAPTTTLLNDRFTIIRLLGSGGMGVVYEALDHERNEKVALKTLFRTESHLILRLKQEFRSLHETAHRNLIVLHELFRDGELWFFTMELVDGVCFSDAITSRANPLDVADLFIQLAHGIHAIHNADKIHRDLKPNNVLVLKNNRVVILDFGLVEKLRSDDNTWEAEHLFGTAHYMAPEQATLVPATYASDWYSFGVMLYHYLTRELPFEGADTDIIKRKQVADAPDMGGNRPGPWHELACALLHRTPEKRPTYNDILACFQASAQSQSGSKKIAKAPLRREDPPFIGRHRELALLQSKFNSTCEGSSQLILIQGISGMGKSALVHHFLNSVDNCALVLKGRCYKRESMPFKAIDALIDALYRHLQTHHPILVQSIATKEYDALLHLFPILGQLHPQSETRSDDDPIRIRSDAVKALTSILKQLSLQQKLVLFIDDLQWTDMDSAHLLESLLFSSNIEGILFLGTYRSDELQSSPALQNLLNNLNAKKQVSTISLAPLTNVESSQLARALATDPSPNHVNQIVREAEGNPFLVFEFSNVVDVISNTSRLTLQNIIDHRLRQLGDTEQKLLELICMASKPSKYTVLRHAAAEKDITSALINLQTHRFIRYLDSPKGPFDLVHDKFRGRVLNRLNIRQQKSLNVCLAKALLNGNNPDFSQITEYFLNGDEISQAAKFAVHGARDAVKATAFEQSASLYKIALSVNLPPELEKALRIELAQTLTNCGRSPEGAKAYEKAAHLAPPEEAIELRRKSAEEYLSSGHMTKGIKSIEGVLRSVGLRFRTSTIGTIADLFWHRFILRWTLNHRLTSNKVTLSTQGRLKMLACRSVTRGLWLSDTLQGATFNARYLLLALRSGSKNDIAMALVGEGLTSLIFGEIISAKKMIERAQSIDGYQQSPGLQGFVNYAKGLAQGLTGRYDLSSRKMNTAYKLFTSQKKISQWELSMIMGPWALADMWCGNWKQLQNHIDQWVKEGVEKNNIVLLSQLRCWQSGTCRWLIEDNVEIATEQLKLGMSVCRGSSDNFQYIYGQVSQGWINLYEGQWNNAYFIIQNASTRFYRSPMRFMTSSRVSLAYIHAYAALSVTGEHPNGKKISKDILAQRNRLRKDRHVMDVAKAHISYIDAALAYQTGDNTSAISHLRAAIELFKKGHWLPFSNACLWQLSLLLNNDEGKRLMQKSKKWMAEQGVQNPKKLVRVFAPGFENRSSSGEPT